MRYTKFKVIMWRLLLLSLLSVASCIQETNDGIPTASIDDTNSGTDAFTPQLVTPIPNDSVSTAVAPTTVIRKCVTLSPSGAQEFISTGRVVISRYDSEAGIILVSSDQQLQLGQHPAQYASVSSTGIWLAILFDNEYRIFSSSGEERIRLPIEDSWDTSLRWLSDENLVIPLEGTETAAQVLVNPFTNERQLLTSDFPDVYAAPFARPSWPNLSSVIFDQTLRRAVYLKFLVEEGESYVLWDMEKETSLWHLTYPEARRFPPVWSPDGTSFALAAPRIGAEVKTSEDYFHEIHLVSRDGIMQQLTNLTQFYANPFIRRLTWSPDGQKIAFWLSDSHEIGNRFGGQELHVLDLEKREVVNYCLSGSEYGVLDISWSPDSTQIATERDRGISRGLQALILNLDTAQVSLLFEQSAVVGWMD